MAIAELPEELFIEILTWLPVKSLLRFRCVSKSICALIDSSDFINSHLIKSCQNFNLRDKLIFSDSWNKILRASDINLDMEEDNIHIENSVSCSWKGYIDCYCNGLLLLHKIGISFTLWNPSARQFRDLPYFPLQDTRSSRYIIGIIGLGLGYDDFIDDYKVFVSVLVRKKHEPYQSELQVWIFALRSNTWRRAQDWSCPYIWSYDVLCSVGGVFTKDGSLHWLYHPFSEYEIVAFDVRNETFSVVPQPVCSIKSESIDHVSSKLHVLEGCLCISYASKSQANLYIRKKDGVDQYTWTPLFSVRKPLFSDKIMLKYVHVLGCSNRGDRILINFGMAYLVSYNLKEKSFRKVEIDMDPIWKYEIPILCPESLVKVSGGAKSEN